MNVSSIWANWQRKLATRSSRKTQRAPQVGVESMETRELLSATALFLPASGELSLDLDSSESVRISSSGGNVVVEASTDGGATYSTINSLGPVLAARIVSINVLGGDDANTIDLRGVFAADFTSLTSIVVDGANGNDTLFGSPISLLISTPSGSQVFGDSLIGGNGDDTIRSQGGNDTIVGGDGDDFIVAGIGDDSISAGDGNDRVFGDDTVLAANGTDTISAATGPGGNDLINAGNGQDAISGGLGNDSVDGQNGQDSLQGDAGDDSLNGDGGTDVISGGVGNDIIRGGEFNDTLQGDDGNDTIDGQSGQDSINGGANDDLLIGSAGNDVINGDDGNDTLTGSAGNDTLNGNAGNDRILGGAGNDVGNGNDGDDSLFGNAGNDTLDGGIGADLVDGGEGADLIRGNLANLSISDVTALEGNSGTTAYVFTITLSDRADTPVTVQYFTADGTARVADNDYQATSASLTFLPGETSKTVRVLVNGDGLSEQDETFTVRLGNASSNATISKGLGVGTILDDGDQTILAQVGDAAVTEGNAAGATTQLNFTVSLARTATVDAIFSFTTSNGTATGGVVAGSDYVGVINGTLTILAGQQSGTITIIVNSDGMAESDETLLVVVTPSGNVQMVNNQGQGTILDDDSSGFGLFAVPADGTNSIVLYDSRTFAESRRFALPAGVTADPLGGQGIAYSNVNNIPSVWVLDDVAKTVIRVDTNGNPIPVSPGGATSFPIVVNTSNYDDIAVLPDPANPLNELIYLLDRTLNNIAVYDPGFVTATQPPVAQAFRGTIPLAPNTVDFPALAAFNGQLVYVDQLFSSSGFEAVVINATIPAAGTAPIVNRIRLDQPNQGNIRAVGVVPNAQNVPELYVGTNTGIVDIFPLVGNANVRRLQAATGFAELGGEGVGAQLTLPSVTPYTLSSGTGNNTVQVGVDGFGSFGSVVGGATSDAVFDPNDPQGGPAINAASSVLQSGLAIRIGNSGPRNFLTSGSIAGTGNLTTSSAIVGTSSSGNSTFPFGPQGSVLQFQLAQQIDPLFDASGNRIGSQLVQTYVITNNNLNAVDFELVRYLNANLNSFDTVNPGEGGGHLPAGVTEFTFESAIAGTPATVTTLVGISADMISGGGLLAGTPNRFDVDVSNGLSQTVANGNPLRNAVTGDGADVDEFVDATTPVSSEYPAAQAFRNQFSLAANGTVTYVTRTLFAQAAPTSLVLPNAVFDNSPNTLLGGEGNDTILAGNGNDFINGGAGDDFLSGGDGNDFILGGAGNDTLDGGAGDDTLDGQGGDDVLIGGGGNDTFVLENGAGGNDTVDGGGGFNQITVTGTGGADNIVVKEVSGGIVVTRGNATITTGTNMSVQGVVVNALGGDDTVTIQDLSGVQCAVLLTVNGGDGNDLITGQGSNIGVVRVALNGNNGNDTIIGTNGDDSIDGGAGNDAVNGQAGNDLINGGDGDDVLAGGLGNDTVNGGNGNDFITGQEGDDSLSGNAGNDTIRGFEGNDTLKGLAGDDLLNGMDGDDSIEGGVGKDSITGGSGDDTLDGGRNDDTINGNSGNDKIRGDHGNDYIDAGTESDTVNGGDGHDTIIATDGGDFLAGGDGNDRINAGGGNDILSGGDGNDSLLGGGGNDILLGGDGDDVIDGQGGTDTVAGNQGIDAIDDRPEEIDELFTLSAAILTLLEAA